MEKTKKQATQERHKLQAEALLKKPAYIQAIKEYEDLSLWGKKRDAIAKEKDRIMKLLPKKPMTISPSSKYFKHIQRYKKLDEMESNLEDEKSMKYKEICSKFSLSYLYSLSELKEIAEGKGFFFDSLKGIINIIRLRETKLKPIPNEQLTKEDLAFSPYHSEIVDDGFLDEEGFLHFKIKAGEPRYMIHFLLDSLLNIYEPKTKKERFRTGYINPFEVFYKESFEGKNPLQIAKELSGIEIKGENPAYNQELKQKYEQVKRASKAAKKFIPKK